MTEAFANAPPVYRLLAEANNAAADRVMLRALPQLDAASRRTALDTLIRRRRVGPLVELISNFPKYGEAVRQDVLARAGGLEHALRAAIQHEQLDTRRGAIRLVTRSGDTRLAYLLNTALAQTCPNTRELAGQALLTLAERYLDRRSRITDSASAERVRAAGCDLAAVIERALRSWEAHLRPEVLTAAAWLADLLEPVIADKVGQARSRLGNALNGMLPARPDPRMAGYVLRALAVADLRVHAARVIAQCLDDTFMAALIAESWVLADTEVRRGAAAVRGLKWLDRSIDPLLHLPRERAAAAMRLVGAIGMPSDAKVALMASIITTGDAYLRHAALNHLVRIDTDAATNALRIIARRKDHPAEGIARHELYRRDPTPSRGDRGGAACVDSAVESGEPSLETLIDSLSELDDDGLKRALRDPRLRTPEAARYVRSKLASPNADDRAIALPTAQVLGLTAQVDTQVYRLAHDTDAVVRANAVISLAELGTPTAVRILRHALADPDDRVQANAIEALDRLEADEYDQWVESKLASPSSRVRANAIKALLRREVLGAAEALVDMLGSDLRGERLSALWVVERLSLRTLAQHVNDLARTDPDDEVRRKAEGIVGDLSGWQPAGVTSARGGTA